MTASQLPNTPTQLVALARRGAAKAARQAPDPDEFEAIARYVGEALEQGQDARILEIADALRLTDRGALSWYLHLARTLSGTVRADKHIRHLVFIPIQAAPALERPLKLEDAAHEIAGTLERALDLGNGSFKLRPEACSLEQLEQLSPLQWRRAVTGETDLPPSKPLGTAGALVGLWSVSAADKPRLSRKLLHAMQRTPELLSWKMRTEALLEEAAHSPLRIFPAMLLQDVFSAARQLRLAAALEGAVQRPQSKAQELKWVWDEKSGQLSWKLVAEKGDTLTEQVSPFPDEPSALVESQLKRLASRFQLKLSPAIP